MNAGTALVLVIVIAIIALALRSVLKKKGSSCGCAGKSAGNDDDEYSIGAGCASCSSCAGCDGCNVKVYGINVDADGKPMDCSSRIRRE